jgi:hypothetical protein
MSVKARSIACVSPSRRRQPLARRSGLRRRPELLPQLAWAAGSYQQVASHPEDLNRKPSDRVVATALSAVETCGQRFRVVYVQLGQQAPKPMSSALLDIYRNLPCFRFVFT